MTEEWNGMEEEKKGPFRKQTEEQKKRYEAEMKEYRAKKASELVVPAETAKPAKKQKAEKLVGQKRTAKS